MIPRLKPFLNHRELLAALRPEKSAVIRFEQAFAKKFEAQHALSFSYGRSALWAFFKAFEIENAEVIMPAYTCVVVAHAAVLSGNIPRFVDSHLSDYNMILEQVEASINGKTRAILATHLFGYPLDIERLNKIVRKAEKRYGHKIWVIQDCAHSFGAYLNGKLVCNEGDFALFGLNISKIITSIFGGMITTNNPEIHAKVSNFRDEHFSQPGLLKSLRRFLYLVAVYPAFTDLFYSIVYWLQEKTPLLNKLTKAYHLDNEIHFPPDYLEQMTALEARVGLIQLEKYDEIIRRRQDNAAFYNEKLSNVPKFNLPPLVEGATYSHYVLRVDDRVPYLNALLEAGIQPGLLVDYSVPDMENYQKYATLDCVNARHAVGTVLNLPIYVNEKKREKIVKEIKRALEW